MLAATLSPSYGIYSGYEHFENVPVREGSEEYLDSEKYEVRPRRLDGPLLPLVGRLNAVRRENPALQRLDNITFLDTANDALVAYAKQTRGQYRDHRGQHRPHQAPGGARDRVPAHLGLPPSFTVHDLLTGERYNVADRPQLRRASSPAAARRTCRGRRRMSGERRDERRPPDPHPPDRGRAERARGVAAGRPRALDHRRVPGPPVVRGRAAVVQARGLLRDPHPRLLRRQRRRLRRLPRPDREARLPPVARRSTASGCCRSTARRCATAATTSRTSPTSIPTTGPSRTSTS